MHFGDLGGFIWIIIVVIAVISSIRRNIARVRRAQPQPAQAVPQMQQPARSPVATQAFAPLPVAPSPVAPPPVAPPPVAPPAIVVAPSPMAFPAPARVGTSPIRGMFGGSTTLVRAIVAAEVLGPPLALQERTIWSPRHSEPSI